MTSSSDREMQEIEAADACYGRMCQLMRRRGPIGGRRFKLEFLDARVETFGFTFG